MAAQDSNDRISELLKQAYPPAVASPEFKSKLRQQLNQQVGALGTQSPRLLWQQPFVWIPAAAACVVAVALVIFFVAFPSVPPTVTTCDATSIQPTAASLNGRLNSLSGSESVEVSFEWGGTTDYGNETIPELRTEGGDITADLSSLTPNTTYHFRLKVVGSKGTSYGPDMQFATGPAAPVVITGTAADIKTTSATLNGRLDYVGSAASVSVSFEWGLTTSYGNETAPESKAEIVEYSAHLSGLIPNTTYHYRAKAVGDGTAYGSDAQFTTSVTAPSVETNDASIVNTTSAILNGELTSMGTASDVVVSFEWGTAAGLYTDATADEARTSTGVFSAGLSGLSPGTTYYCRAKALGGGNPVFGIERQFTTPIVLPSLSTTDPSNMATTSATLNGYLTSPGSAGSVVLSFEWGIAPGTYTHRTASLARSTTGAFSADLDELTPGTTYYYRAKAEGDGNPVYGAEKAFTTATTPPTVTTTSATHVRCTLATLNGVIDSLGTAASLQFYFEWGMTTAYGNQTEPEVLTTIGGFRSSLNNLKPKTTYHFRAKAVGDGAAYGADMMFTTSPEPPPEKTWYLTKELSGSVKVMYDGDTSKPEGVVRLRHTGPTSWVWKANESSGETTYPKGNWTVQLTLGDFEVGHTDSVEIGTWDGSAFTTYGACTIHGLGQDSEVYVVTFAVEVGSFTMPPGSYVAIRITVTSSPQSLDIHLGGSQSYVQSPAYPEPIAPSVATDAATSIDQTTAILNGSLDGLGSASSVGFYFEWGLTEAYGNMIDVGSLGSAGSFNLLLTDLDPNTIYHFRAKAVGDGTNYGVDMTFTTLP